MTKIIFNTDNQIVKLSDDANVSNLNIDQSIHIIKDISSLDFDSIRQNLKRATLVNDAVVLEDLDEVSFDNSEQLSSYLTRVLLPRINPFIDNDQNNPMWNDINTYKTLVDETINGEKEITYPVNSSWEKYCSDNSITYFHPLQIP
jgi:hypothetical protein